MQKDLKELISKNSEKLNKMLEQKKPYEKLLKQSQLLDDYITEYYNENKES